MVENSVATRQQKTVWLRFAQIKGQFTRCPCGEGARSRWVAQRP